jgi:rod shape-determining protein MreD
MDEQRFASALTIGIAAALLVAGGLLLLTPLNLAQGYIPTPFFPLIVIFLYGLERPESLPPIVTFTAGLLQDLLFGAAIGPWATVYLLLHAAIIWQRSYFAGRDSIVLTTGFAAASLVALLIYWIEMSILGARTMPLFPLLVQTAVTIAVFPIALFLFNLTIGRQRPSLMG